MRCLSLYGLAALLAFPCVVSAQPGVIIEFPQGGDPVSGVFVIRGIDCNNTIRTFSFGDSPNPLQLATGLDRGDAAESCNGNINVGFAGLFNAGLLPRGENTIHFRDAANNIVTSRDINVVNFGLEFKDQSTPLVVILQDQPMDGITTEQRFSVPAQGFQASAIRLDTDPDPSGEELNQFLGVTTVITATLRDGSTRRDEYNFTRSAQSSSGFPVVVDDTPMTNSAFMSNNIQGLFGAGATWRPSRGFTGIDQDNCLLFSVDTTVITPTISLKGYSFPGNRDSSGKCSTFPLFPTVGADPVIGEIVGGPE